MDPAAIPALIAAVALLTLTGYSHEGDDHPWNGKRCPRCGAKKPE